jgi:hypothetical protein
MFKRTVVGCKSSPEGRDAVALGAAIASATDTGLSLVCVYPTSLFPSRRVKRGLFESSEPPSLGSSGGSAARPTSRGGRPAREGYISTDNAMMNPKAISETAVSITDQDLNV